VSCAETAELIDLPFGLWTRVGRRKDKFNHIRQVPTWEDMHWRHLANTTEPSVCGGDAVLCQITLTTCYIVIRPHRSTTYVDAVWSVCLLRSWTLAAKTSKPIEMMFELWARAGQGTMY